MTTYVIATTREDRKVLFKTLKSVINQLKEKTDEVIIVVDSQKTIFESELPIKDKRVRCIGNTETPGVGGALDSGVLQAKNDRVVIMGCDVILPSEFESHLGKAMNKQAITCFVTTDSSGKLNYYGAEIADVVSGNLYRSRWIVKRPSTKKQKLDIPCVLGAAYVVSREFYLGVKGFKGHRGWGTLEPLISLKYWMAGGKCQIYTPLKLVHLFNRSGNSTKKTLSNIAFNQLHVDSYFKSSLAPRLIIPVHKHKLIKQLPKPVKLKYTAEQAWDLMTKAMKEIKKLQS